MTRSGLRPARAARAAALVWIVLASAGAGAQVAGVPAPIPATAAPATTAETAAAPEGLPGTGDGPEAAAPASPVEALVAPPPASGPADPLPLALPALERAWRGPAAGPAERAARVRAAADGLGISDVDPAARALLVAPGASALERAAAAVRVAPGLPAAQLALAAAEWREGAGLGAALAAAVRALAAMPRHLESLLWLEATLLTLLYAAALGAGLLWIAARGVRAALHAAHDLADRVDPALPGFARAAFVAAGVLAPAALGEGAIGAALALFALAWWAGDTRQRRALGAAAALVALALGPLAGAAGRALSALSADPVVLAATASETGFLDPADASRLERAAAAGDPLAVQALGRRERRAGDFERASALIAPLLEDTADPALLNDAAHVKLLAGDPRGAIVLYRRAIDLRPSADLWFNLAQAHVRAIDMEAHAAALDAAQAQDAARTRELTQRLAESDDALADLPLPVGALRARLLDAADPAAGAALRAWVAPGRLGRAPWGVPLLFVGAGLLASALARAAAPSRCCPACGARLCRRCGSGEPGDGVCAPCARKRLEARHGGPWERGERSDGIASRLAGAAARLLPGFADREPLRPGVSLAALAALAAAAALWTGRAGVVSDPAAVGASGPLALAAGAAALLAAGVALTVWSRREGR